MGELPHWLEVSLTVDGELAEAVSDVIARFASNGVVVERGVTFNDSEDEGTPIGPVRVYGYLPIDESLEVKRQGLEEALWHLGQIQPLPYLEYKNIVEEDWMVSWKQHYQPIPIGRKLLILPAWLESEYPDRIAVRIDPSMAFGTGTHPTTQLCLELLEDYIKPGENLIDVGCGSGILSIAGLKLGMSHALGVDIDPQSIRSTRENAATNEVLENLETGIGSVQEILAGNYSVRQAPVVLANILAPVILRLFEAHLGDLVLPGGVLILSGILDHQANDVVQVGLAHGFTKIEQRQIADWVAIVMKNSPG
jgi:ribosomal protein L11 methyltransferase